MQKGASFEEDGFDEDFDFDDDEDFKVFPTPTNREKIKSCLSKLREMSNGFKKALVVGLEQLVGTVTHRIRPVFDNVAIVSYELSEEEYVENEVNDPWVQRLLHAIDQLRMAPTSAWGSVIGPRYEGFVIYKKYMLHYNADGWLSILFTSYASVWHNWFDIDTSFWLCNRTFKLDIVDANSPKLLSWIWKGMKWMANNPKNHRQQLMHQCDCNHGGAIISEMRSLIRANICIITTENLPRVSLKDEEMVQGKYEQEYEKSEAYQQQLKLKVRELLTDKNGRVGQCRLEFLRRTVNKGELRPPKLKMKDPNKSCVQRHVKKG
uniref:Conserved oligomeric Golgi complex subunit 4 n=1 Tax=Tanacetum cinerariifolium TaxID=118510 RepID=A0A6L2MZI5_TANCI|nr:conserved oligomeric Golgi complex subunit 4 [Tanacetum cinerariifolium]